MVWLVVVECLEGGGTEVVGSPGEIREASGSVMRLHPPGPTQSPSSLRGAFRGRSQSRATGPLSSVKLPSESSFGPVGRGAYRGRADPRQCCHLRSARPRLGPAAGPRTWPGIRARRWKARRGAARGAGRRGTGTGPGEEDSALRTKGLKMATRVPQ